MQRFALRLRLPGGGSLSPQLTIFVTHNHVVIGDLAVGSMARLLKIDVKSVGLRMIPRGSRNLESMALAMTACEEIGLPFYTQ